MKAAFIFIFLFLLTACADPLSREQQADLERHQEVIRELGRENLILRDTNDRLRNELIVTKEELMRKQEIVAVCEENYPPLSNMTFNDLSPLTHVPINDILVGKDQVVINVPDLQEGIVSATKSMEPFLDHNDVVLESTPAAPEDIHEKDIIVFEKDGERIIHRVVEIDHDTQGWYAITKGDNNLRRDPWVVRFHEVRGVVVGVIY